MSGTECWSRILDRAQRPPAKIWSIVESIYRYAGHSKPSQDANSSLHSRIVSAEKHLRPMILVMSARARKAFARVLWSLKGINLGFCASPKARRSRTLGHLNSHFGNNLQVHLLSPVFEPVFDTVISGDLCDETQELCYSCKDATVAMIQAKLIGRRNRAIK
jgi:hypothetical protein